MKHCLFHLAVVFTLCISLPRRLIAQTSLPLAARPSYPLNTEQDLSVLINEIGDARIVLLGESSHGTSEFYNWRAAITKRLLQEKGFNLIAAEAEWADSRTLDQFITHTQQDSIAAVSVLSYVNRWPYWTWANYETAALITWLNQYNQKLPPTDKVHFVGLDLYCIAESIAALESYTRVDPYLRQVLQNVKQCFLPYGKDALNYGSPAFTNAEDCQPSARALYERVQSSPTIQKLPPEEQFVWQQYARVIVNGEAYFRIVRKNQSGSWNVRDRHMATTVTQLLKAYGPKAKLIVWAHNTHVGDARYTTMPQRGKINLGQLLRQELGEKNTFIVGFGTYKGTVASGNYWGDSFHKHILPPSISGSWEYLLHQQSTQNRIILSRDLLSKSLATNHIRQRGVGAVYNPKTDAYSGYVYSLIPRRYDAFIYIDETSAVHPLPINAQIK
jgi:erythromycin esterase